MATKNESFIDAGLHIAKECVKCAGYGALALGAVAIPFGGLFAVGGAIGSVLGLSVSAGGGMLTAVLPAMQLGAMTGGLFGVTKGAIEAPEAIQNAKQDRVFREQQELGFKHKQMAMMAQQQQMAMGGQGGTVNSYPNVPFNPLQNVQYQRAT